MPRPPARDRLAQGLRRMAAPTQTSPLEVYDDGDTLAGITFLRAGPAYRRWNLAEVARAAGIERHRMLRLAVRAAEPEIEELAAIGAVLRETLRPIRTAEAVASGRKATQRKPAANTRPQSVEERRRELHAQAQADARARRLAAGKLVKRGDLRDVLALDAADER